MTGFFLKSFIASDGKQVSRLNFESGANLVTGASDTGKSYVFSAISHVLGRSAKPKDIDESKGYDQLYLEIVVRASSKVYTLFRKIGQKDISVIEGSFDRWQYSVPQKYTTSGTTDTVGHISNFLLSLMGLDGRKLLQNRSTGSTVRFGISQLLSLTFIDEVTIIKESSPFYFSSQYNDKILAQSLLHLLLTGQDFSEVEELEDKVVRQTKITSKLEFLDSQISHYATFRESLVKRTEELVDFDERERFLSLDNELKKNVQEAKEITGRKNELITELEDHRTRFRNNRELLDRFTILKKQYEVDNDRLNFILEVKTLSDQLGDTVCPICNTPFTGSHLEHLKESEEFTEAALQEIEKNKSKLNGLEATVAEILIEQKNLEERLKHLNSQLEEVSVFLVANFTEKIQSIKSDLKGYLEVKNVTDEMDFIDRRVKDLFNERNKLNSLLKVKEQKVETTLLSYTLLSELAESIKKRLSSWNFESFVEVNFDSSYNTFDIVISGKNRRSYGKGKRSISYAASLVGLMDLCANKEANFSYLLIMDSPLTTYEEKKRKAEVKANDLLNKDVLKAFFEDIVDLPENSQVIVFDNKEPDANTLKKVGNKLNVITFTGDETNGRVGFFDGPQWTPVIS